MLATPLLIDLERGVANDGLLFVILTPWCCNSGLLPDEGNRNALGVFYSFNLDFIVASSIKAF